MFGVGELSRLRLQQPRQQLYEITRLIPLVQLIPDQPIPGRSTGSRRPRQTEHERPIRHPRNRPRLNRRPPDLFVGQHPKHLPETLNLLVQEWPHRLRRAVAPSQPGATRGDHHVRILLCAPLRDDRPDLVHVVDLDPLLEQAVTGRLEPLCQQLF